MDISSNLYIAESARVRLVTKSTGIITTYAGGGTGGGSVGSGDGGAATSASLYYPYGVALDISGNLYIADYGNQRIRLVRMTCSAGAYVSGPSCLPCTAGSYNPMVLI